MSEVVIFDDSSMDTLFWEVLNRLELCEERYLTSDEEIVIYLNKKNLDITNYSYNTLIKACREMQDAPVTSSVKETVSRLLMYRNKVKNALSTLSKKILVDLLANGDLKDEERASLAVKAANLFDKTRNVKISEKDTEESAGTLLDIRLMDTKELENYVMQMAANMKKGITSE